MPHWLCIALAAYAVATVVCWAVMTRYGAASDLGHPIVIIVSFAWPVVLFHFLRAAFGRAD